MYNDKKEMDSLYQTLNEEKQATFGLFKNGYIGHIMKYITFNHGIMGVSILYKKQYSLKYKEKDFYT